eukprot:scaffold5404_cov92-Skeletonema_dohrnii-CCMP3373.AAC.3
MGQSGTRFLTKRDSFLAAFKRARAAKEAQCGKVERLPTSSFFDGNTHRVCFDGVCAIYRVI